MVVATGFFDGVHLGHQLVIKQLVEAAKTRGEKSMIITFWPHPRNVLQKEAHSLRLLSSLNEKKEKIYALGVDYIEVVDFNKVFSKLTAREYLRDWVMGRFGANTMILGYDNKVGSDASDSESVAEIAYELGLEVIRSEEKKLLTDTHISSTLIRKVIKEGRVEDALNLLGERYLLHGVVVSGNMIGRTIGFPTANMQLYEPLKVIPANGVYLVEVQVFGRLAWGMCNVGNRPTIGQGNARTIETHIFDFSEDIYGLDIKISFCRKIRSEIKFENIEKLKGQLEKDKYLCKELIAELSN